MSKEEKKGERQKPRNRLLIIQNNMFTRGKGGGDWLNMWWA